jgi:hypothetical protein
MLVCAYKLFTLASEPDTMTFFQFGILFLYSLYCG